MINIRNCIFGFKCTADWDAMKITSVQTIRHCARCKKDVHQISTKEELFEAIQLNRCVAIFDSRNKPDLDGISLSMPTLGVPARYKRNKNLGAENTNINDYDIPAFLRKPDDKK
jgi:hypothetical protein